MRRHMGLPNIDKNVTIAISVNYSEMKSLQSHRQIIKQSEFKPIKKQKLSHMPIIYSAKGSSRSYSPSPKHISMKSSITRNQVVGKQSSSFQMHTTECKKQIPLQFNFQSGEIQQSAFLKQVMGMIKTISVGQNSHSHKQKLSAREQRSQNYKNSQRKSSHNSDYKNVHRYEHNSDNYNRSQSEYKKQADVESIQTQRTIGIQNTSPIEYIKPTSSRQNQPKKASMSLDGRLWTHYDGESYIKNTNNNTKQKQGFGILYFANGDKFIGNFEGDRANGHGTYYDYLNQVSIMGIWEQSCLGDNPIFSNLQTQKRSSRNVQTHETTNSSKYDGH